MADKKTFKDMAGALPTTTSDMSKVMVQMADGSVGWIKKEDLAQVAAELMPVATVEGNGLMSKELANRLIYKFTVKQDILYKITGSGVSVLAVSGNSANSLISLIFGNNAAYKLLSGALGEYHFNVWKDESMSFYVKMKINFADFNCLIQSGSLKIEEAEPNADTSTMTKLQ